MCVSCIYIQEEEQEEMVQAAAMGLAGQEVVALEGLGEEEEETGSEGQEEEQKEEEEEWEGTCLGEAGVGIMQVLSLLALLVQKYKY
jgi:hypothetical protein